MTSADSPRRLPAPFIDAHAHLFPDRLLAAIWRAFRADGYALWHEGDAAAVAKALLATEAERIFLLAYAHKGGVAPALNEWLHQATKDEPRFVPFGAAHPDDENFPKNVATSLDDYGFAGIKLHCSVQKLPCDDARLNPLYELVQDRDKAVIIHAGNAPYDDPHTGIEHAFRLVKRFPGLRVIFAHMGMWDLEGFCQLAGAFPHVYLDCSATLAYPRFEADPRFVAQIDSLPGLLAASASKVLWGSDYPFLETGYEAPLHALAATGLPEGVLERIRYGNARDLLARIWPQAGSVRRAIDDRVWQ